jgi:hypothetical protein
MDYGYSTEADEQGVYHVLYKCTQAKAMEKKFRIREKPPASQGRKPCKDCLEIIREWLAEAKTQT